MNTPENMFDKQFATRLGVLGLVPFVLLTYDKRMYRRFALPEWFVELRFRLTCVVVTTQMFTFLAANIRS